MPPGGELLPDTPANNICRFGNVDGKTVLISCSNFNLTTALDSSLDYHYIGNDTLEEPYQEWEIVEFLNTFYIPVIIIVGIVGNVLSCVVFLNTRLRMRSSSYYLAALAITDVTYIVILFIVWLELLGYGTFNVNIFCQLATYIGSVSSSMSVWLTVAFTVERFIAVQYPLQRPNVCTIHRAKTVVGSLLGFSVFAHFYVFLAAGVIEIEIEPGYKAYECNLRDEYLGMMTVINYIDTVLTLILPFVLIVVMNTLIARQLIKFSKRFRQRDDIRCLQEVEKESGKDSIIVKKGIGVKPWYELTAPADLLSSGQFKHQPHITSLTVRTTSAASSSQQQLSGQMCYCSGHAHHTVSHHTFPPSSSNSSSVKNNNNAVLKPSFANAAIAFTKKSQESQRSILSTRTQYSITKMLLLTSTVFILLNLPSYAVRLYHFTMTLLGVTYSLETQNRMQNWQFLCLFLQHTHYSINFVFYSTCGTTFRRCLFQLLPLRLRLCCKPNIPTTPGIYQ